MVRITPHDYEFSEAWSVLAGPADEPIRLGALGRAGRRWEARTTAGAPAGGEP